MMFVALGISSRTAWAEIRDTVSFDASSSLVFRQSAAALGVTQCVTLSTCNRCEVFFWGGVGSLQKMRDLFLRTFEAPGVEAALQVRTGLNALVYLFRIASGFESMVFGEYQILGQVKDAHAAALASGHIGRELDRILREAVSCAKHVRTELDFGAVPPSVCRVGIDCVDRASGFVGKCVFVIGSGKTGSLAVRLARERGATDIAVSNRSPERVQRLVAQYQVRPVAYADRYDVIAASDIVISATASPHVVVEAERLALTHPVCFLDLASPRDIDSAVAGNPCATLFNIDSIGEMAAGDRAERERLTALGTAFVDAGVGELVAWLNGLAAGKEIDS